jgi:hypothetical protein
MKIQKLETYLFDLKIIKLYVKRFIGDLYIRLKKRTRLTNI